MSSVPRLEARDLWFEYDSGKPVLRGVDLALEPGSFTALVGQNGSGKTTLAKHFLGLLRPSQGRVLIDGHNLAQRSVGELARSVGYLFQNPDHQLFESTVEQELELGPRNLELAESEVQARVEQAAAEFGLTSWLQRRVGSLSYGQRKTLSLAAVSAIHPQVLILDEPTTGLHWQAAKQLLDWLAERNRQGHTLLLITHDMRLVAEYARQAVLMLQGRIAAAGPPQELFGQNELLRQARIQPPQIVRLAQRLGLPSDAITVQGVCEAVALSHG